MRRVLIANQGLEQLAGSEIHAMQLAEHFHGLGDDVTLAGLILGEPFLSAAKNLGLTVKNLRDPEVRGEWDVIWTHQQSCYLLAHAMMNLKARQHIHGCLSYFVRLEASPLGAKDADVRLLANSDETSERLDGDFDVLRNITPAPFPANPKTSHCSKPRRIVIVSNHPPSELREAATLLRGERIEVVIYGVEDEYRLIDETVLIEFDVVVTIGKTVQYALAQAVPVFVYDHFGGPGYLSRDTWQEHEAKNYSGRSSPETKDAQFLSQVILGGYGQAVSDLEWLRKNVAPRYDLAKQLEQLGLNLSEQPKALLSLSERLLHLISVAVQRPLVLGYALAPGLARRLSRSKPNISRAGSDQTPNRT